MDIKIQYVDNGSEAVSHQGKKPHIRIELRGPLENMSGIRSTAPIDNAKTVIDAINGNAVMSFATTSTDAAKGFLNSVIKNLEPDNKQQLRTDLADASSALLAERGQTL